MASVKGANITNIDATPIVKVSSEVFGGKMRVQHDTFEASSLASGSDITIARVPKNATIHDVVLKCDALGSDVTVKDGDEEVDDRWVAGGGRCNVAGQTQSMLAGSSTGAPIAAVTGLGHRTTAETDILITTGGASASGTIFCWVYYSVE